MLGAAALIFNHVFGFPGAEPSTILGALIVLVALDADYSIFLSARIREESIRLGTGPGIRAGLARTGGVITTVGVVLAATFAALAVQPTLSFAQFAGMVVIGVLLDTLLVRSLLIPALCFDLGPRIWLPGRIPGRPVTRVTLAGPRDPGRST